jgi:hypothetical protein
MMAMIDWNWMSLLLCDTVWTLLLVATFPKYSFFIMIIPGLIMICVLHILGAYESTAATHLLTRKMCPKIAHIEYSMYFKMKR